MCFILIIRGGGEQDNTKRWCYLRAFCCHEQQANFFSEQDNYIFPESQPGVSELLEPSTSELETIAALKNGITAHRQCMVVS